MAQGLTHAPDLTVSSLVDGDFDYAAGSIRCDEASLGWGSASVLKLDSHLYLHEVLVGHTPLDLDQVCFVYHVAGMGERMRHVTVVGEEKQALRLQIQPTDGVHALLHALDEGENGAAALRVERRGDGTLGFVESQVNMRVGCSYVLAIYGDVVVLRVNLRPQLRYDLAVHSHDSLLYHGLAVAPRGHACTCHEFLKSLHPVGHHPIVVCTACLPGGSSRDNADDAEQGCPQSVRRRLS